MCLNSELDNKMSTSTPSGFLRKIRKPLIERKRRGRINKCLSELKSLLLEDIKRNGGTQISKLDKADILEMTVSMLRQTQHQQLSVAMATSASVIQQYRQGFTECASEAIRFMDTSSAGYPPSMTSRMQTHLTTRNVLINESARAPSDYEFQPIRKCRSASPTRKAKPGLSPVFVTPVKQEQSLSALNLSMSQRRSQSSILSIPSRVSVNVNDSPPQSQVWRPF